MGQRSRTLLMVLSLAAAGFGAFASYFYYFALPPLVRGLPKGPVAALAAFQARVGDGFPPGTDSSALRAALQEQTFTLDPAANRASYVQPGLLCDTVWGVNWDEAGGKITSLSGDASDQCK